MAIFFGDELRSSNSDYPIIDIAENNAKGVIFVDALADFTAANIPNPKIAKGVITVDRATGNVYIYTAGFTNSDGSGGTTSGNNYVDTETAAGELTDFFSLSSTPTANWKIIGNTPVFADDIYANIGTVNDIVSGVKRTFGKYENGDLVPTATRTALEVIKDALTSYQDFDQSDIDDVSAGTEVTLNYDITDQTGLSVANRGFKIRNRNRNSIQENAGSAANTSLVPYGINSIQVNRTTVDAQVNIGKIVWNGSGWTKTGVLNTADAETGINSLNTFNSTPETSYVSFSFDDSVDVVAYTGGTGEVTADYEIVVEAQTDGNTIQSAVTKQIGDEKRGRFKVAGYVRPTVGLTAAIGDASESGTAGFADSAQERSFGNVDTNLTLTVQKKESETTIGTIKVYRGDVASGVLIHEIQSTDPAPIGTVLIDGTQNGATQPVVTYNLKDYLDNTGVSNYGSKGLTIPGAAVNSISYSVEIEDDGGADGDNSETYSGITIQFRIPFFAGTSQTNPANSTTSTIETIISGGSFLKKANSQAADFFYKCSPSISGTGTSPISGAIGDDIFVPPAIGNDNFTYICLPNSLELTDIAFNGSEPVLSDFGGTTGQGTKVVNFSNGTSKTYRVYGNSTPGGFAGSTLDIS
jgi:hypothetical protein